ncbi:MAG: hypothetical protein ACI96M_000776, partial [Candidatus Azotimanducaceae bacterium]
PIVNPIVTGFPALFMGVLLITIETYWRFQLTT